MLVTGERWELGTVNATKASGCCNVVKSCMVVIKDCAVVGDVATGTAIRLTMLFGISRLIDGAIGGAVANVGLIGLVTVEETSGWLVIPVATVGIAALGVVVRR